MILSYIIMTKLFKNLTENLSRVNMVFGGGPLDTLKDNNDLIDLNVESILFDVPSIQQDKRNLRGDRNIISNEYTKAVRAKKLELSLK